MNIGATYDAAAFKAAAETIRRRSGSAMVEEFPAESLGAPSTARWSLLLSWLPIIGDPLTVVAGVLREPLWSFVAIIAVAKVACYLAC